MFGEKYVELHSFDDVVLTRSPIELARWLARGFVRVPEERLFFVIYGAFDFFTPATRYAEVWSQLFPQEPLPPMADQREVLRALLHAARAPIPRLYVVERVIERGRRYEPVKFAPRPLPPRTKTDHYVLIEAVSDAESAAPVAGLRLELLIADGEVRGAQTDSNGLALVERIQAERAVIRVLDLDGGLWRPAEGDASQLSGSSDRPRLHEVKQGECLSRIARRYGFESWSKLWNGPENAKLRKRRKSPHVLHPGDEVVVPGVSVHEIIRPTDATHRLVVTVPPYHFAVVLRDFSGLPFAEEPYELWVAGEAAPRAGKTDHDGMVRAVLPTHAAQVDVRCKRFGMRWHFAPGALDPLDGGEAAPADGEQQPRPENSSVTGLQARLHALGYAVGATTGRWTEQTDRALLAFQTHELGARDTQAAWTAESYDALNARYGA